MLLVVEGASGFLYCLYRPGSSGPPGGRDIVVVANPGGQSWFSLVLVLTWCWCLS